MPKLFVTPHAIGRFHARWAPGLSFAHAKRELILLASRARATKRRLRSGHEVWLPDADDKIVFVVDRRGRETVLITVLPPESVDEDVDDPELAA